MHMLSLEDIAHGDQVMIAGIGAAADADLIDLHAGDLADRADMVRRMRQSDHRLKLRQIDGDGGIIDHILIWLQFAEVFFPSLLLQEGQRRLPVQYAKRMVGNKMYGGQSSFIPLRVNTAGVIPIIFASSVLLFPYTVAGLFQNSAARAVQQAMSPNSPIYMVLYVIMIVFFSYFYTAVVFKPEDISNNMKKNGGFILGIRPGKPTTDYIEKVMGRITLGGAVALAIIAVVPTMMTGIMNINTFYFGGTAVIIVVGVALDTVHQIEGQLLMRHYEGILKRRGGRGGGLLKL